MGERDLNEDFSQEIAKNDDEDSEMTSDSILAALNFALILSTLSSSGHDEERLSSEETEEKESGNRNRRGKDGRSRPDMASRRQQVSGCSRALQRHQMSKVQTKIRDCRHSRRL